MGGNKNSSKKATEPYTEDYSRTSFGFDLNDDEEENPNRNSPKGNDQYEKLPEGMPGRKSF